MSRSAVTAGGIETIPGSAEPGPGTIGEDLLKALATYRDTVNIYCVSTRG